MPSATQQLALSFDKPKRPKPESQAERVFSLLSDGRPWRTDSIVAAIYGKNLGIFRLAARIHELRKSGLRIDSWRDPQNPSLTFYQLKGKVQA